MAPVYCRVPSSLPKMTHQETLMRVAAVVCGILAMHQFGAPAVLWNTLAVAAVYRDRLQEPPRRLVQRWTKRFLETGNVEDDLPREKKRKKNSITDGEACLAAQLFKNGYHKDLVQAMLCSFSRIWIGVSSCSCRTCPLQPSAVHKLFTYAQPTNPCIAGHTL